MNSARDGTTTHAYPDIPPSNAFMGNVMRQDILSRAGLTEQVAAGSHQQPALHGGHQRHALGEQQR